MCQIIYKPDGHDFDLGKVDMAVRANPHGFTLFWKVGNVFKLERTMSAEEIMVHVKDCPSDSPAIFHARKQTRGDIAIENTHPFEMGDAGLLWHNGTVFQIKTRKEPDSKVIADIIGNGDIETAKSMLELFTDSRFILFRKDEDGEAKTIIVNEDKGAWIDDQWYSKPSLFKNSIPVFVYGTLKKGHGNHGLLQSAYFVTKAKTERKMVMVQKRWAGYPHVLDIEDELAHQIPGEIYLVSSDDLKRLDNLEGYREKDPDFSHYIRIKDKFITEAGETVDASIYVASKATIDRMDKLTPENRIKSFDLNQESFIDELFDGDEEIETEMTDEYGNQIHSDTDYLDSDALPFEGSGEDGFPETNC